MFNLIKSKLPLAAKFYVTLLVPLILVSIAVSVMTFRGLQNNASKLADVLRIESKTNRILSLLLVQDDASKAMLIDPNQLEKFSSKKIEAYDDHKKLLLELQAESEAGRYQDLITKLLEIDEQKLRPADSLILEKLFENVEEARTMYFDRYEIHKGEYETLIRELAAIGAEDLSKATAELHDNNLRSLLHISFTLLLGIFVVVATITLLSRAVEKSDANTRSLLSVLSEGLFFFDKDGYIAKERSQSLVKILPGSRSLRSLQAFVDHYAPQYSKNVPMALHMLWQSEAEDFFSDLTSTLSLLPRQFTRDGNRTIHIDYRPLSGAHGVEKVIVVVTDVTEKLRHEKDAVVQAERVKKISRVAANVDDYISFLEESVEIFKRADGLFHLPRVLKTGEDLQLRRDLHTLKGSLATVEFNHLAASLHELESALEDQAVQDAPVLQHWEQIKDQWKFETTDIAQVLDLAHRRDRMSLSRSNFERIQKHAQSAGDRELQGILVDSLRLPPHEAFGKYESLVEKLAERLGSKQVQISYARDCAEVASFEIHKLDGVFVHILRNCIDHGIESPEQRREAGKPVKGTIQWAVYRKTDGWLHFIIKDDGQGVNAEKLAQKALKSGLWTEAEAAAASEQDKVDLLFRPQLSSRDEVTELSGRGVGMDAVKEVLQKLGGTITVYSQSGVGTQFEIDLPPERWRRSA